MLLFYMTSVIENSADIEQERLEAAIIAAADGDADALGIIYDAVSTPVYGYALSLLGNTHDAEDALHECFIAIWNGASGYTPERKPMAWIMTITRNICYLKLRSNKRASKTTLDDALAFIDSVSEASLEDKLVLRECLEGLSEEERQIVILHVLSGFRHREIAGLLDMGLATVLSKYSRAVKKLKNKLSSEGLSREV